MKTSNQSDRQDKVDGQRHCFPEIKNNAKSIGKSRNQIVQKKVVKLPNIKKNKIPFPLQKEKNQSRSNKSSKKKAQFVLSMENKMKNVLANLNLKMPDAGYNSSDSEDFDLEFKIKKNKQLIRNGYFQDHIQKEGNQNFNISNQPKVNFEKQISNDEKSQDRPFSSRDISNDNVLIKERNQILYDRRPRSSKLPKNYEDEEKQCQFDTHKDNNLISQNLNENIDIQYAEDRQFPSSIEKNQEKNLNVIKQDQNISNKIKKEKVNTTFVRNIQNQMKDVLKGLNYQIPEEGYGTYETNDFNFFTEVKKNKEFLRNSNNKNKETSKKDIPQRQKPKSIRKSLNEKQNYNQNQDCLVKNLQTQDKNHQHIIRKVNSPDILNIPINKNKQARINRKNLIPSNNPSQLPKKSQSKGKIALRSLSEKKMPQENINSKPSLKLINRKDHIKKLQIQMKIRTPESQAIIDEVLQKRVEKFNLDKGYQTAQLRSAKKQLDQKVRHIEEQLKIINSDNVTKPKKQNDQNCEVRMRFSSRNWKKVKIDNQKIECQEGSFDEQLQRIQQLQRRGQKIFGDYLQNRMMLMQLNIHNKQSILMEEIYMGEEEKNDEYS